MSKSSLLPADGRYVAIADYPELAEHRLKEEADWLRFLNETKEPSFRAEWQVDPAVVVKRVDIANRHLAEHKPVRSPDGLSVRLPLMTPGNPSFSGYTEDGREIWYAYEHFIQAAHDETGTAVGAEVVVRNTIVKEGTSAPLSA